MRTSENSRFRHAFCLLLTFILLSTAFVVIVSEPVRAEVSGDYDYVVVETEVKITGYHGLGGDIAIPSVIDGKPVTLIGDYAFVNCRSLTSVIIPSSVRSIGAYAFADCDYMASVVLPEGLVGIGWYAFQGCDSLASITIPSTATSIGNNAFQACTSLRSVTLPDNMATITKGIFVDCTSLASVNIPSSVTVIKDYAFDSTALTSVVIPSSVTSIEYAAFGHCYSLTAMYFNGNAPMVGANWLYGHRSDFKIYYYEGATGFTTPTWDGINTIALVPSADFSYQLINGGTEAEIIGYAGLGGDIAIPSNFGTYPVTSIGESAFNSENGHLITSVVIPDSIRTIGAYAFQSNLVLTSVTLGSGVTTIGGYAFAACTSLGPMVIPDNVMYINGGAFEGCTGMMHVTIGSGVIVIGGVAFNACRSLADIEVSPDNAVFASVDGVVYSKDLRTLMTYPAGRHGAYEIPYGVTTIGDSAMSSCPWITSLTIPNSVTYIGFGGLAGTSLTSITIPDSVTEIGGGACVFSPYLASITVGSGVTTIGYRAFAYCPALTSITFTGLVAPTILGGDWVGLDNPPSLLGHAYASSNFPAPGQYFFGLLMDATISEDYTFTVIDGKATITDYTGAGGDITIPSTLGGYPVTSIGDSAFDNENGRLVTSVVIPDAVSTIGAYAFRSSPVLTSVTLGSGVTTIGGYAFLDCVSLGSIVVPDNVIYIGDGAFQGCTALTSASIGSGVTVIGGAAFHACRTLVSIDVSANNAAYTSVDGVVYSKDLKTLVAYPAGRHGPYEIPYGVETIGNNAMSGCPWITSLTIPNSVTYIADAGLAATSLTSITIPDSVTTIGSGACVFSPYLASVTIGSGVTSIGIRAFAYCPSLSSITFEGMTAPTIVGGDWVGLENAPSLEGHAYAASDFPTPGQYFYGLLMGTNIYVPPTVAIDSPLDGSFVRTSSVTVRWLATDALSEIGYYMVKLDGGRWTKVVGDSFTFTKLKAGAHTATVQAYGDTGILAEDSSSFTVDMTSPSLRITSPLNGATVSSSSVTVQWTASDPSGVDYFMVRLDNGAWVKVEDMSSYAFSGVANGKHTVTVQAFDSAGNSKATMVKFTVRA